MSRRNTCFDELATNNKEVDKDVDTEFIGAKRVVKPDDDNSYNTENTNINLPGACFWGTWK